MKPLFTLFFLVKAKESFTISQLMNRKLLMLCFVLFSHSVFAQFDVLKKKFKDKLEQVLGDKDLSHLDDLQQQFEQGKPVSTSFNDAIYEVNILKNFNPQPEAYLPLALQPRDKHGQYTLRSGLYTMNARSFCLKAGTYGPSQGDGHLYAPLLGEKGKFVQEILERYASKPDIPQADIQVVLWAIVAGADLNSMAAEHQQTLARLFTIKELLKYKIQHKTQQKKNEWMTWSTNKLNEAMPPFINQIVQAEAALRQKITQHTAYKELEKIAILSGVAPEIDKIRDVTMGRWSYHPRGYFIRFFPNGYQQTRVDVYVPHQNGIQINQKKEVIAFQDTSKVGKEVIFNPSENVATPANRSAQRIGVSALPVEDIDCYDVVFGKVKNSVEEASCGNSKVEWVVDRQINQYVNEQGNVEIGNSYERSSNNYHCYYVENTICDMSTCASCNEEQVFQLMQQNAQYAAPTDSKLPLKDGSINDVNLPCDLLPNPIISTVHPKEKAIINYTRIRWMEVHDKFEGISYTITTGHLLHPGKVQRKVFREGTKIKIATMGEGSGILPQVNIIYAKRTWGAVDGRMAKAMANQCKD